MSQREDIYGIFPIQYFVPPGASLALLIEPPAGENGIILRWISGGTLHLMRAGATVGGTYTGAELGALYTGATSTYVVSTSESINLGGAPRFYAAAIGTTSVFQVLRATGPGF